MKRSITAVKVESEPEASEQPKPTTEIPQRIEFLPVVKVAESKSNPRKSFGDMSELIESVRTKGFSCRCFADRRKTAGSWSSALADCGQPRPLGLPRFRQWCG